MISKRTISFIVIIVLLISTIFTSLIAMRYRVKHFQTYHEYRVLILKHYHLKNELHTLFQKRKEIKAWQTDWYKPLYDSEGVSFQEEQKKRIAELEFAIDLILDNYKEPENID